MYIFEVRKSDLGPVQDIRNSRGSTRGLPLPRRDDPARRPLPNRLRYGSASRQPGRRTPLLCRRTNRTTCQYTSLIPPNSLQRASLRLLPFNRLEQRLEVALAEATRAAALNDFEEQRRAVGDRLGENLKHVPPVVAIHEDAQRGQLVEVLLDVANTRGQRIVVRLRHTQEGDIVRTHRPNRFDAVVGNERDVLHAAA